MKKVSVIIGLMGALFSVNLSAQQDWCGSANFMKQAIKGDPRFESEYKDFIDELRMMEAGKNSRATNNFPIVYVPVVFHIVHDGDAIGTGENIGDAQALSAIDALNRDFNFMDPDIAGIPQPFKALVGNVGIKFCIAQFDPAGNPTTGIIRHQYQQPTWDNDSMIDRVLKPATIWDHAKYLNIWSVRMGGELLTSGVLAYAALPFSFNSRPTRDGVVARYNTIGTTGILMSGFQEGKTLTHEVGHWFGLLHIWGDDNGKCAGEPQAGTDFIGDTPDQGDLNFGCPVFPRISCNNGPNGDMFMNYMDYSNDDCRSMFTIEQAERMRFFLDGTRSALKTATSKCFYNLDAAVTKVNFPVDTICSLNFKPVVLLKNAGVVPLTSGKFYYRIDGGGVQIYSWNGLVNSQEEVYIVLPQVTVTGGAHNFQATFGDANGLSGDNNALNDSKTSTFYAYEGGTSVEAPFSEGFEGAFPAAGWSVENPNNDATWEKNGFYGAYNLSASSIYIDNFSYTSNPNKKRDALVTDIYDLSGMPSPALSFDVAYARYSASRQDSLNVYYSLNCGGKWVKIWNQRGAELATAPDQTDYFVPTGEQWKTVNIPLPGLAGQSKAIFKFENVTGWGNVLALDNINLQSSGALGINGHKKADVQIFPNPAIGLLAVRLPYTHSFKHMQLLNSIGEVVYESNVNDNSLIFSIGQFAAGLYFVHLQSDDFSQTEKVLIAK